MAHRMNRIVLLCLLVAAQIQAFCPEEISFKANFGLVCPARNSSSHHTSSAVLFSPTVPGTSLFSLPNVKWKNRYTAGFEASASAEYAICSHWRVEGEFLYQNFKREVTGTYDWQEVNAATTELFAHNENNQIHKVSSYTQVYTLLPSLCYDFRTCSPWVISLGAGAGVAWLHSGNTKHKNVLKIHTTTPPLDLVSPTVEKSPTLQGTAFAWQFKAVVIYAVDACMELGLTYRLFGTTRFQASSSSITTNPKTSVQAVFKIPQSNIRGLLNNSLSLFVSYKF